MYIRVHFFHGTTINLDRSELTTSMSTPSFNLPAKLILMLINATRNTSCYMTTGSLKARIHQRALACLAFMRFASRN